VSSEPFESMGVGHGAADVGPPDGVPSEHGPPEDGEPDDGAADDDPDGGPDNDTETRKQAHELTGP
jgi:hypothetical protein